MSADILVSVVVPIRNDADLLPVFLAETTAVLRANYRHYEVILVDDGSDDLTPERLSQLLSQFDLVRCVRLSRRFGEEVAIAAGLDVVIGDYTVVLRVNEDPPELIPRLVDRACRDGDIVYGVRLHRRDEPWWYRLGARLFYWYVRRVVGIDLPADTTQFRCLSRQVVNAITGIEDRDRYLRLLTMSLGFRRVPVEYSPLNRRGRNGGRGPLDSLSLAVALITDNSAHPLRLMSWLGLTAAAANMVYAAYVLAIFAFRDRVAEGWVTLSLQSALQFLLISLILTVLCEYVGRIFGRLRSRPAYYVSEERNSAVLLHEPRRNVVQDPVRTTPRQPGKSVA